jgi:transcriptional regulator with XRE-family HTH domain
MSYFSKKIKELRSKMGLSQRAMAEKIGTTAANYQCWEVGKYWPTAEILPKIASLGNMPIDALFFDTPYEQRPKKDYTINPREATQIIVKHLKKTQAW